MSFDLTKFLRDADERDREKRWRDTFGPKEPALPSRVTTLRQVIRNVPAAWARQYCRNGVWADGRIETHLLLLTLDLETATPADVAAIIGNNSWVLLRCHECDEQVEVTRECGQPSDYESATADLCRECLGKAFDDISSVMVSK